jgi:hypothetical protein
VVVAVKVMLRQSMVSSDTAPRVGIQTVSRDFESVGFMVVLWRSERARRRRYHVMTDAEVELFLGEPGITTLRNGNTFTGPLKANGDGTYSVDMGLGELENRDFVQRFMAAEIESIRLL